MATSRGQRIGIWVIAVVMLAGTVGGFVAMMVAPGNQARDEAALKEAQDSYSKALTEYQTKVDEQAKQLSQRYLAVFAPHASRVKPFDVKSVQGLATKDIVVGEGPEVKDDTTLAVYYIGWNPKGEVFDQSLTADAKQLKAPFRIDGPAKTAVITGWKKGLIGMKLGGVRQITIPADQAYGEAGQGDKIPANTPLKFVVMAIDPPAEIAQPEMPAVLQKQYQQLQGGLRG